MIRRSAARACVLTLVLLTAAAPRRHPHREAFGPPPPPTPYDLCDQAVEHARTRAIPPTLLPAIARVESGRLDPSSHRVRPWPWTINVEGAGIFFPTKVEAIAAVHGFQARGTTSIDVGCMQINLRYHPTAFPTLDAAFDPDTNAAYAVRFLTALHAQTNDWNLATAQYHSQTQALGEAYQKLVFGRVVTPMGPATGPGGKRAGPYSAWPPPGVIFGAIPPPSLSYGAFAPAASAYGAFAPAPLHR